jgi:acyl-CoA dehydrogenase
MSEQSSELRGLLADTVARLFTQLVTKELIEAAEKHVWPGALWRALEEGGLTLPLVPEKRGGAGGTWQDAHVVIHAAGLHTVPVPLAETIVAGWLLAGAGLEVPLGPLTFAPARGGERLRLARAGGGWRLSGRLTRVPWGGAASHVVTVVDGDSRAMVALIAAGSARVTGDHNLALEPRDTLVLDAAPVIGAAPAAPGVGVESVQVYGALVRSAQIAGALDRVLTESLRYAGERRQFGRAIGSFQVIQHYLAVLAGHCAAAGIAAAQAFRAADRGDPIRDVAVAKVRVGEAAGVGAGIAHQVHGAIGFTYEHSLHFATRRLWSWRAEFGSESHWATRLGRQVTARGADALWPDLTAYR